MWTDDAAAELEWASGRPRGTRTNCFAWLPDVVQLEIAESLSCPSDCGALCIAMPRLGLVAIRQLQQYKDPLVSVAMRLAVDDVLVMNETLMRRYLWEKHMTADGCEWLTAAALKAESPLGCPGIAQASSSGDERWHLTRGGPVRGAWAPVQALVRKKQASGKVYLYEGERGEERKVRMEKPSGDVSLYEGEHGQERKVRLERPSGNIHHFEGERGAERKVRVEKTNGSVFLYEGEMGAERAVRAEHPDGAVAIYEGEKGAEREVRIVTPAAASTSTRAVRWCVKSTMASSATFRARRARSGWCVRSSLVASSFTSQRASKAQRGRCAKSFLMAPSPSKWVGWVRSVWCAWSCPMARSATTTASRAQSV